MVQGHFSRESFFEAKGILKWSKLIPVKIFRSEVSVLLRRVPEKDGEFRRKLIIQDGGAHKKSAFFKIIFLWSGFSAYLSAILKYFGSEW